MEVERKIKVFNQADTCKTVKKTYNVEYKELPSLSKSLDITKNGNYQVTPDCGYTLNKADIKVNVELTTPTPVVTKESTELIADYAYWLKEVGRAGAKVFLSQTRPEEMNWDENSKHYYLTYPLEIGKTKIIGLIVDNQRTIDFEIYLKKGINTIYIVYNAYFFKQYINGKHIDFIKFVEIPNCVCTYGFNAYIMFNGNYKEKIEIKANEEGLYKGSLIINDYTNNEFKPEPKIRFCKPVCDVLYGIALPVNGNINDLTDNNSYMTIYNNIKHAIVYTTNPQSYDWKLKKVNPTLGIKLKYHNTFVYKENSNFIKREKIKTKVQSLRFKLNSNHSIDYDIFFLINLDSDKFPSYLFRDNIYNIFNTKELSIELLCTVNKSYPYYEESKKRYLKHTIGKKQEYLGKYDYVFNNLKGTKNVMKYIRYKLQYLEDKINDSTHNLFKIKIRLSVPGTKQKKLYYCRIPCYYDESANVINCKGIILEKIEDSIKEYF